MTRWLRALTALAEKQGSIPSSYSGTQPSLTFIVGDPISSSDLHEYLHPGQTLINIKEFF